MKRFITNQKIWTPPPINWDPPLIRHLRLRYFSLDFYIDLVGTGDALLFCSLVLCYNTTSITFYLFAYFAPYEELSKFCPK